MTLPVRDDAPPTTHPGAGHVGYPPAPPAPPRGRARRRRRRRSPFVTLLLVFAAVVLLGGGGALAVAGLLGVQPAGLLAATAAGGKPHTVLYEVTGAGRADITYNRDGMTTIEQLAGTPLPWSLEVTVARTALVATVFAQRTASDTGSITCRILVDGVEAKTATSSGPYVIASCSIELQRLGR